MPAVRKAAKAAKAKVDKELAKVYFQASIKNHAGEKSMWAGSFEPSVHSEYILRDGFVEEQVVYSDCLFKIFDEPLVNAIDQYVKMKKSTKKYRVTEIEIEFLENGYISIFNDGQGIPIAQVPNAKGDPVWIPELISTEFLAGSNNVDDKDRIIGGTNGLGLSLCNVHSKHFILETTDLKKKKHYIQHCRDNLSVIEPPTISKMSRVGTKIKFLPDYKKFGFDMKKNYNDLLKVFESRAYQIAAHSGTQVKFNGEILPVKNIQTLGEMFLPPKRMIFTTLKGENHDWDVVIGISNTEKFECISIINGIHVKGGSHINYIKELVISGLKPKAEKLLKKYRKYKKSMIENNLFVLISGNIPNPGFNSQTKTTIGGSVDGYKQYTIKSSILDKIWKLIEFRITELYLDKQEKPKQKKTTAGIPGYTKARHAGKKEAMKCSLLYVEGKSANSLARKGLTSKEVPISFEYYGTFEGGMGLNALKFVNITERSILREKKLNDNVKWNNFNAILNLDYDKTYKTDKEFKTLNYGCVISFVDQDLDGVGQIHGILMSHIALFWPALIRRGFLKRLATPVIRAVPTGKGLTINFYDDGEYKRWKNKKFGNLQPKGYIIKYYKGLATNSEEEAIDIMRNASTQTMTYSLDKEASKNLNLYYGKIPDLRKKELKINRGVEEWIAPDNKLMSCSEHLRYHTRAFQLANVGRTLRHIVDGLIPSWRKILCAGLKKFTNKNMELKVFQFCGFVAEYTNYHHGSASIEGANINMAQTYVGANNMPLFLPMSMFGSRAMMGKDHGASRYIKTKLNYDLCHLLFRKDDLPLLEYTFDEGERNEPVNYVPTYPLALAESIHMPATGWSYGTWARNPFQVIKCIESLIKKTRKSVPALDFWGMGWKGKVRKIYDEKKKLKGEYLMGEYTYDSKKNTIRVTELPYQVGNESYINKMLKKKLISDVEDDSTTDQIDIKIRLKSGAIDEMRELNKSSDFDHIEEYCLLRKKMSHHLNFINDGIVQECSNYKEILLGWFNKRRELYEKRIERLTILTRLRILIIKEVIKFVEKYNKYKFGSMDEKKAIAVLNKDKYIKCNKTLLDNPEFAPVSKLEELILRGDSSYNYLLNIGPRQCLKSAREKRAERLAELEKKLNYLEKPNTLENMWLGELAELKELLTKVVKSPRGWLMNEKVMRFKK